MRSSHLSFTVNAISDNRNTLSVFKFLIQLAICQFYKKTKKKKKRNNNNDKTELRAPIMVFEVACDHHLGRLVCYFRNYTLGRQVVYKGLGNIQWRRLKGERNLKRYYAL